MPFDRLERREFIILLGGAVAAWPIPARGQQRATVPRLGALLFSTPQADPQMQLVHSGLRELGYVEGRNLSIEYRWAAGKVERLPELAKELVLLKVNIIVASSTPTIEAAKRAAMPKWRRSRVQ